MDHQGSYWSVEHDNVYRAVSQATTGYQQLNNPAWRAACTAGVARRRLTHRGYRGGAHKHRGTHVQQMGVNNVNLLSITLHNHIRTAKLCLINSRSVCNKAEFLVGYVTSHDIDIMCITETWLRVRTEHLLLQSRLVVITLSTLLGVTVVVLFRSSFHIDHS